MARWPSAWWWMLCFIFLAAVSITTASSARKTMSFTLPQSPVRTKMRCPRRCQCNATILEVDCSFKRFKSVPQNIPAATKRLVLTGNRISRLRKVFFRRLKQLEVLEVNHNRIKDLSERVFQRLRKLTKLDLSSNEIEHVPSAIFSPMKDLRVLLLQNNNIGKLSVDFFRNLTGIHEIDLSRNELQTLEVDMFSKMPNLKAVFLHENRWHCDCQLKNVDVNLRQRNVRIGYLVCDSPHSMKGTLIANVKPETSCGASLQALTGILLGSTYGIMAILFAVFMCRRRAALEVETGKSLRPVESNTITAKRGEGGSRSSIISVLSDQAQDQTKRVGESVAVTTDVPCTDIEQPLTMCQQEICAKEATAHKVELEVKNTPKRRLSEDSISVNHHENFAG